MSSLTDPLPDPLPASRHRALSRLWGAMASEAKRKRVRRNRMRWAICCLATVTLLGISPTGFDGEAAPLIGLADAVAASPVPAEPVGRHWYARIETRELVSVPVSLGGEGQLQFLVTAVEEQWHDAGDLPRRTVTYGSPRFLSPEDEDAFYSAGLAGEFRPGRTRELPFSPDDYQFATTLPEEDPEVIASMLRRRVAGLGDQRMEEVRLLQLTSELIQVHANDSQMRAQILRVIADIPGILVIPNDQSVVVSIDFPDGDRPLRLMYEFDADSAHLVGEYLAALATQTEPATVLRSARHSIPMPLGVSES